MENLGKAADRSNVEVVIWYYRVRDKRQEKPIVLFWLEEASRQKYCEVSMVFRFRMQDVLFEDVLHCRTRFKGVEPRAI
jgi:hypothetical protein